MTPQAVVTARSAHAIDPDDLFAKVADFSSYPQHCPDVLDVTVSSSPDHLRSDWTVAFRGGLLKWEEIDQIDTGRRISMFDQTTGDFATFRGGWRVLDDDDGNPAVEFDAVYDIGIASLADLLNPVAGRALVDNVASMLRGIVGHDATITSTLRDTGSAADADIDLPVHYPLAQET